MVRNEIMNYLDSRQQDLIYSNDDVYFNNNKCATLIINDIYIQFMKIEVNNEINHLVIDNTIYIPFKKIRSIDLV